MIQYFIRIRDGLISFNAKKQQIRILRDETGYSLAIIDKKNKSGEAIQVLVFSPDEALCQDAMDVIFNAISGGMLAIDLSKYPTERPKAEINSEDEEG